MISPARGGAADLLDFVQGPGDICLGTQIELQDRRSLRACEAGAYNLPVLPLKGLHHLAAEQTRGAGDESGPGHGDAVMEVDAGEDGGSYV
jgi:hypothetical protein